MKGIILNLLQAVVEQDYGDAAWDEVLETAGASGIYTALGNYPDSEMVALVDAVADQTGRTRAGTLRWFGRKAMPHLADRYPAFFQPADPVTFVTTLHDVIHAEVMKLYPGATPPSLSFTEVAARSLVVDYRSGRAMADLAIGFLEGAADVYGTTPHITATRQDATGTHVRLTCRFDDHP